MGGTLWDSVFIASGMIAGAVIVRQGIVEAGNELRQGLSEAGKGFMAWPRIFKEQYSGAHTSFTSAKETHTYFLTAKEFGATKSCAIAADSSSSIPAQRPEVAVCGTWTVAAIGICMGVYRVVFSFTTTDG